MRECLGWITNCPNSQTCPQNWLELSVWEIPTTVLCHVCEQNVSLVATEKDLEEKARADILVAFPVVPCTGFATTNRAPSIALPPMEPEPVAPPPAVVERAWFVTLASGESVAVDKETMIVGRSRTCDIVIPSAKVSRQHASLTRTATELYIEDLGSANGVWLNGEKVTRVKVNPGDMFTISDETLVFDNR